MMACSVTAVTLPKTSSPTWNAVRSRGGAFSACGACDLRLLRFSRRDLPFSLGAWEGLVSALGVALTSAPGSAGVEPSAVWPVVASGGCDFFPRRRRRRFFALGAVAPSAAGASLSERPASSWSSPADASPASACSGASAAGAACSGASAVGPEGAVGSVRSATAAEGISLRALGSATAASSARGLVCGRSAVFAESAVMMSFDSGTMLFLATGGATYPMKRPHASPAHHSFRCPHLYLSYSSTTWTPRLRHRIGRYG